MKLTIDHHTHPHLRAQDLFLARDSGGRIQATIGGIPGAWRVLRVVSTGDVWRADLEIDQDPGPPTGPLSGPQKRRG